MKSAVALSALVAVVSALAACGGSAGLSIPASGVPASTSSASSGSASSHSDGTIIVPGVPAAATVNFEVRSDHLRKAISPLIYGVNLSDFTDPRIAKLTFNRAGGNRLSAYNWENNASNAGLDYFHQNDAHLSGSNAPGAAFSAQIQSTLDAGAEYVMTIPMIGYVAADKNADGDVKSSANYLSTRFNTSVPRKGAAFTLTPDTTDHIVYQDEYVNFLKSKFPQAFTGTRAKISFMLDNEPDLWAATHKRLRGSVNDSDGQRVSYSELFQLTKAYATAIKDVAPNALIFGPANFGWSGYIDLAGAPDANGRDFIEAYLDEMKAYEVAHGRRIVDVLDLHYYPEARSTTNVRVTENDGSAAVAAARVQSVRSLYDPGYTETSWITQYSSGGPIKLLPRIFAKIDAHYPGTKLSFGEYNFGGANHISGGVAQADVLGIFGREGIFSATLWEHATNFILGGFEMFRNFDGNGGRFGDTSIKATTTNGETTAIYASVDATNDKRVVLVMINRSDAAVTTGTRVWHNVLFTKGEAYRLAGTNSTPQDVGAIAVSNNTISMSLPAYSVTTVVLSQ